ncbi:MAG TPA: hypothetical protein VJT73_16525 [Polyangiaceae bacterium]|nr:hypothetical protein [Polyangiaceae bacterium]
MTAARIHALALLAWAFVLMLAKKVLPTGPRGLALFKANFEAEKLSPVSTVERAELPLYSRCIACGRCNVGDGPRRAASSGAYPGTMALMLASSRSMPNFSAAREALSFVTDDELAAKEALCPTEVPMRRIAAFIRAHA